jgi:phosphopantothenoylcysteine decarboxylase/phosphopantothenate--cysteine ligase
MFEAVKKFFDRCDCLIMAAAVADYTPVRSARTKLKKSDQRLTIRLKPTPDILKWAGKRKNEGRRTRGEGRIVVGFALEDKAIRARAEKKLRDKNLDMIVANTPAAIGADRSDVHIKTPNSPWIRVENATKAATAKKVVALAAKLHEPGLQD